MRPDSDTMICCFQEMIRSGSDIYLWHYNSQGVLLSSTCPEEAMFAAVFTMLGCLDETKSYGSSQDNPVSVGTALGLVWYAAFKKQDGQLTDIYTLGPVLYRDVAVEAIRDGMKAYPNLEISQAWLERFYQAMYVVPVASHILMSSYVLMLHNCLTGEGLTISDVNTPLSGAWQQSYGEGVPKKDRQMVYLAEQALLQMVRTGDLDYRKAFSDSIQVSNGVPVAGADPLRSAKISLTVFISLVSRAAIEGGLSPENAYSVGDQYLQSVESARDMTELSHLGPQMYDDFIRRVHRARHQEKISPEIRRACDYIRLHPAEALNAHSLGSLVGYTDYYFTRKFQAETGCTLHAFIQLVRIEKACLLLLGTDMSLLSVAEESGFSSRHYFNRIFMEHMHCTPGEYRKSGGRIADKA